MTAHTTPGTSGGVPAATAEGDVIDVQELSCLLPTPDGDAPLVDGVSFSLARGQTIGIVGESGSGKTMFVRSIMSIGPKRARVTGRVLLGGVDLLALPKRERRRRLGSGIGMVFQNPMTSLNPVVPIGRQITEALRYHQKVNKQDARDRAIDLLQQVGISSPQERLKQYPHQLSGGQRQRIIIASALACDPDVLIADEATTALDVTVQKQILDLIKEIQDRRNMSVVIISHDLGVVAGRTDKLIVMYSGQVVESGPTAEVFARPQHRYTGALLASIPELESPTHSRLATIPGTPRRPSPDNVGCAFASRCAAATDECRTVDPEPTFDDGSDTHWYRCYWPGDAPPRPHPVSSTEQLPAGIS